MMRGKRDIAIAVRRPDASIVIEEERLRPWSERYPMLKLPILRGFIALIESMLMGLRALNYSANQAAEAEGEEISSWEMAIAMIVAVVMAVVLFVVVPTGAVHFVRGWVPNVFMQNLIEGVLRIAVFLLYVVAISRMRDIQRVFEYHGAEHKVIHTYEAGVPLTVDHARGYSILHPRCGTSFLLVVMVASILVFSFLGNGTIWWKLGSRVVLLPLVAGLGYEVIKWSSRHQDGWFGRVLTAPGLWLQHFTAKEPDDEQLEVALTALKQVLTIEGISFKDVEVFGDA
ncbi:MAG: DUF1385 domain-containing protein [Firmicutes bacterium]|nr:DUF1385 domain-containing protein [Bacillota bacterium]